MFELLASLLVVTCLGIAQADHHLIAAGCDTNKTCFEFAGCGVTTSPSTLNLATIYTTGDDTVEFQLQYDNANAGWIAIGLSNTPNMPNTYVFMCVRPDANVVVQERFASARARPPIVTSLLTTESTANEGSLFNCTFTSPVTRTPMLNNINGYWVLLAWGQYNNNNIQQHASPAGRCVSSSRMTITDAVGAQTTAPPTDSPTQPPSRCTGENTCISYSDCSITTLSNSTDIASYTTLSNTTMQFNLEYTTDNLTDWIAIGFSTTASMDNSFIFLCHRDVNAGVTIQERYADIADYPSIVSSDLTPVSYLNSGPVLNCTFTSPVTGIPDLNNPDGYHVLLARGRFQGDIQYHGSNRCLTGGRIRITDAIGDSGSIVIPAARVIFAMVALLFASYLYL